MIKQLGVDSETRGNPPDIIFKWQYVVAIRLLLLCQHIQDGQSVYHYAVSYHGDDTNSAMSVSWNHSQSYAKQLIPVEEIQ